MNSIYLIREGEMVGEKSDDDDNGRTNEHNQNKLREVQGRIARVQKLRMMERAATAQSGSTSLSRGDISMTYVARPAPSGTGGPGAGTGRTSAVGIIVWDPGSDRDKAMEGDFDSTDSIVMGDKDPNDKVVTVPKW
jgi:hypothetical protein